MADVAALASTPHIRVLAGGGAVLEHHGIKPSIVLPNATILVDPASATHLVRMLLIEGWSVEWESQRSGMLPRTRATMRHPARRCGLDLHYLIPGFFADPEQAFDAIWERRCEITMNGVVVPAFDRQFSLLVAMQFGLGRFSGVSDVSGALDVITAQVRTMADGDVESLLERAVSIGGTASLRPLMVALERDAPELQLPAESYARWRLKLDQTDIPTRWLLAVAESPRGGRMRLALRTRRRFVGGPGGLRKLLGAYRNLSSARDRVRDGDASDPRGMEWAAEDDPHSLWSLCPTA
ncbi:hypothetical protein [Luethyella okanaganae]|uniref:Uncharacterized protein n=1 Tax=Luethyella okanaganae TaxID=69372 RepID=A0ABW1VI91_9MICO